MSRISIGEISESDFIKRKRSYKLIFSYGEYDKKYAIVTCPNNNFLIGWKSDLIEPEIVEFEDSNCFFIAIDQFISVVDSAHNDIIWSATMDSNFLSFINVNGGAYALFEFGIYEVGVLEPYLSTSIEFTELCTDFTIDDDSITVHLIDGNSIHLE